MIETQEVIQRDSETQTYEQAEPSSSWYDLTLKIGAVVLLAVAVVALFWPMIMHKH
jgi:hypothetical protein